MLEGLLCKFKGHDWSPEDFNEFTGDMDIGDEVTLRCKKCNTKVVTIEKLSHGAGMKWTAHVEEAVLYEVTDLGKKYLDTENLKEGAMKNLDKFREDYK